MGPRQILLAYLVLFSVAVPWYWQFLPIADDALVLGMPAWAFGATIGSLSISLFSAWILSSRWPCEEACDQRPDNEQSDNDQSGAKQSVDQQSDAEQRVNEQSDAEDPVS